MEWFQLKYFQTVARTEHFTQAAQALSISQPALSRSISNLEQELGTNLFDRRGRNVYLNQYGQIFLLHLEKAIQNLEEGKQKLQELLEIATETVSLGFIHSLGVHLVPDLIEGFHREYPNVQFGLVQSSSEALMEQLRHHQMELCLSSKPENHSKLQWRKLFSEALYIITPKNHPFAERKSIRLEEIAEDPFIGFKQGIGMRKITDDLFHKAKINPKTAFEGDEISTVAGLVGAGLGVSLTPYVPGFNMSKISLIPISYPISEREIGLVWAEDMNLSKAANRFKEFVQHAHNSNPNVDVKMKAERLNPLN